jgi:hypothetical protein
MLKFNFNFRAFTGFVYGFLTVNCGQFTIFEIPQFVPVRSHIYCFSVFSQGRKIDKIKALTHADQII